MVLRANWIDFLICALITENSRLEPILSGYNATASLVWNKDCGRNVSQKYVRLFVVYVHGAIKRNDSIVLHFWGPYLIVGILKILKKRSRIVAFFSRKCPYRTHVLDAIATPEAGCSAPGFTQRKRSTIFMFWSYLICALASGAALRFYLHAGVSATTFWAHARWLSFCRKLLFFCVLVPSDR